MRTVTMLLDQDTQVRSSTDIADNEPEATDIEESESDSAESIYSAASDLTARDAREIESLPCEAAKPGRKTSSDPQRIRN